VVVLASPFDTPRRQRVVIDASHADDVAQLLTERSEPSADAMVEGNLAVYRQVLEGRSA
jgi:hypothetical protein